MIEIKVGDKVIGEVERISIASPTNQGTPLSFQRVRFNREQISNAFARGFVRKTAQRTPLQVEYKDDSGNRWHLQNIWITEHIRIQESDEDEFVILEQCNALCESMIGI